MRECEREDMLCTCVDWGKDDLAARKRRKIFTELEKFFSRWSAAEVGE